MHLQVFADGKARPCIGTIAKGTLLHQRDSILPLQLEWEVALLLHT